MVNKINENEFDKTQSGVSVVDFNATWCGPCKMLGPVLEDLSGEYEGKVNFFGVDVDDNQDLAIKYGIQSIPAIVVFKDGKEVNRQVGFVPKPALKKFIDGSIA